VGGQNPYANPSNVHLIKYFKGQEIFSKHYYNISGERTLRKFLNTIYLSSKKQDSTIKVLWNNGVKNSPQMVQFIKGKITKSW